MPTPDRGFDPGPLWPSALIAVMLIVIVTVTVFGVARIVNG
jgi:hypothetical protein